MNYTQILDYWFGNLKNNDFFPARKAKIWYRKDVEVDKYISENFREIWELAQKRQLGSWQEDVRGMLAIIIVLDQFSRHMFRQKPEAYAEDTYCVELCLQTLPKKQQLLTVEKAFLYMPLQHSENLDLQEKSVVYYRKLVEESHSKIREQIYAFYDYAAAHCDIIKRFGRFPHRNVILGRTSTKEEQLFLQKRGLSYFS
ncbi:DUF924 family protein [Candidatus Uabimicrobium sp. HlEnr_7]|uniref:DUF924 family protein n=1 Tax=Candidatus Uabimicrobium helgolandensis TaxID=3095367 RepID=UPI0035562F65